MAAHGIENIHVARDFEIHPVVTDLDDAVDIFVYDMLAPVPVTLLGTRRIRVLIATWISPASSAAAQWTQFFDRWAPHLHHQTWSIIVGLCASHPLASLQRSGHVVLPVVPWSKDGTRPSFVTGLDASTIAANASWSGGLLLDVPVRMWPRPEDVTHAAKDRPGCRVRLSEIHTQSDAEMAVFIINALSGRDVEVRFPEDAAATETFFSTFARAQCSESFTQVIDGVVLRHIPKRGYDLLSTVAVEEDDEDDGDERTMLGRSLKRMAVHETIVTADDSDEREVLASLLDAHQAPPTFTSEEAPALYRRMRPKPYELGEDLTASALRRKVRAALWRPKHRA